MSWHLFAVFFASTFFISATPGPNMLLAFQYGLNYGVKRTLWTLAGLILGCLFCCYQRSLDSMLLAVSRHGY